MTVGCGTFRADPPTLGPFDAAAPLAAACVDDATQERTPGTGTSPKVDLGDPTIQASVAPPSPGGQNGWYINSPLVNFVCTDALSGVAVCPRNERLPDGTGPWIRTTTDVAGRTGSVAVAVRVDTTPPPPPAIGSPAASGTYEIGRAATISFGCGADATSGVASCSGTYGSGAAAANGGALDVGEPGNPGSLGTRSLRVDSVDVAGNRSSRSVSYTVVDTTRPSPPALAIPAPDAVTSQRSPAFTWGASTDAGVGMKEYRINVGGKNYVLPASAAAQAGFVLPDVLADGTYEWQVLASDAAGNTSASPKRRFRVDPNAVAAPTITSGPTAGAATANRAPEFTFTGLAGSTFSWRTLNAADEDVPGGSGNGQGRAALPPLPDGTYTFTVSQVTAAGLPSEPAVALFRVDTEAPPAPRVTAAPTVTGETQPSFAWAPGEQGGVFTWEVLNPAGARVQGPGATTDTSVRLPSPLSGGAFQFRVRQTDAAGNPGPWSTPAAFTVVGAPSTGGGGPGGRVLARPATRNAKLMSPRAGAKLVAATARLRWKPVKGAVLYNVQIFRLTDTRYTKVLSAFPRTAALKVPKGRLRPGQRYAWRVWPYNGKLKKYARTPLGISWFDTKKARAR